MKILILVLVVAVACAVLFATGAFSPSRSRRLQNSVDDKSKKAETKGYQKAGSLGDMSGKGFRVARKAADRSGEVGREMHDKITPD
jgi:hypothetical protein